jgi:hypothetical protein
MLRKIYIWLLFSRPIDLLATIGSMIRERQADHIWRDVNPEFAASMSPPTRIRDALRSWWLQK